jgi:hypothetical protein
MTARRRSATSPPSANRQVPYSFAALRTLTRGRILRRTRVRSRTPRVERGAPWGRSGPARSDWRSCNRSGAGPAAPPRHVPGSGTCSNASSLRAGPSRPRRRRSHKARAGPDCRTRLQTRAAASTRARRPHGSTRASRARRGSGSRRGNERLAAQSPQPLLIAGDVRVDLAVGAIKICARHQAGAAVARAGHEDRAQPACPDRPVHVRIDEVEPRGSAPMSEQPRLDVLGAERLAQERVVEQVDLAHRKVVRRSPPGVDRFELKGRIAACGADRSRWS